VHCPGCCLRTSSCPPWRGGAPIRYGGWNVDVEFIKSCVNQSTSALPWLLPSYIMRPLARRSTYMSWWWNVGVEFIKSGVNQFTSALPCPLPSYIMRPLARRSTYMLWWVECRCGSHQDLCEPVHECTALAAAFVHHHAPPGEEEHLCVMVGGM